ncbi:MAG: VWA domain-containing protein [Phycisphaeraceae bacterium]|nr:VWA domain-containing protein [Phycisphaeraceae bacterium]
MPRAASRASETSPGGAPARRALPWIASIALHAALIVGAGFVVWRIAAPPDDPPATAISFDAPSYNPTHIPDEQLTEERDAEAEQAAAIEELLKPDAALTEIEPDLGAPDAGALDALTIPVVTPGALTIERPTSLGATFAGLAAGDARDVVYVVDGSGSMLTTLPDVLDRLRQSIEGLHPTQRFQVIVFQTVTDGGGNTTTYTTPPARNAAGRLALLPASADMKAAVEAWLSRGVKPRGRSNPTQAIEAALDLRPDAVFLLSSRITDREGGSFDADELLRWLDEANPIDRKSGRRRVLIQTVQVLDEDPEQLLQRIAQTHGGPNGYNYISREELTRAKADRPPPTTSDTTPSEPPDTPR